MQLPQCKCLVWGAVLCGAMLASASAQATTLPWQREGFLADPFKTEKKASDLIAPELKPEICQTLWDLKHKLSPNEIVIITLCNNPSTRSAYLSLMGQAASFGGAYAAYMPDVGAGASWSNSTTFTRSTIDSTGGIFSSTGTSADVSAGMTLYDFGRREASFDAAEQSLFAAGHNYDSTLQNAIAQALAGYYSLLASQEAVDVAVESERYAKESYDAASLRHQIGQAPAADELEAKGSYSEAQLTTQQAKNELFQDQAAMALLMGFQPGADIIVAEVDDSILTNDPFGEKIGTLMEQAKQKRFDLIAARDQIEGSKASLRALERSDLPSISASAGTDTSGSHFFNSHNPRSQSIGVSVSIPLFSGFSQTYNERAARDLLQAQQEDLRKSELQVMQDVWNTWHDYETSKQSWVTSWDLLASATKLKEVALGRYTEGLGTILDVLSAQSQYSNALESQLKAHYNLLTARINLVRAVGVLNLQTMHSEKTIELPPSLSPVGDKL